MLREFFETLQDELSGIGPTVKVAIPPKENSSPDGEGESSKEEITIYLTCVNMEKIDRVNNYVKIRVLITAYYKEELEGETMYLDALEALDDIINYLDENKRNYNLIATPESMTNNIWSTFRTQLRPFLMYECPVSLA